MKKTEYERAVEELAEAAAALAEHYHSALRIPPEAHERVQKAVIRYRAAIGES